jgi:hypothetical protein
VVRRLARPALAVAAFAALAVALPYSEAEAPPGAARLCADGSDAGPIEQGRARHRSC